MPESMSDERLAAIEHVAHRCPCISDLLAEVRRLRRALHLSETSRGVPSGWPRVVTDVPVRQA
jgi:hypothetical protein